MKAEDVRCTHCGCRRFRRSVMGQQLVDFAVDVAGKPLVEAQIKRPLLPQY
ncbi:hypothetical protein LCGC14_2367290 [marine sediment metagenome]|uniref:Uncharacterized protein n=1 Tax=marine sediment metagenome TaxID=412755 RepID=A0A0F9EZN2_9ZZZZ